MRKPLSNLIRSSVMAIALLGGVHAASSSVEACPNCKDALAEDPDGQLARLGQGYSWSVLLMLGVPGLLVAGMGSAAYFFIKRSDMSVSIASTGQTLDDQSGPTENQSSDS